MSVQLDALRKAAESFGSAQGLWEQAKITLEDSRSRETKARNTMIEARKALDKAMEDFNAALPKESA